MLILMLAFAMTLTMLVATFLSLHHEAERVKHDPRKVDHFGFRE